MTEPAPEPELTAEKRTFTDKPFVFTAGGGIKILSPKAGNTVPLTFTAAGSYDPALGNVVTCQLYKTGTTNTVGGPVPATLYNTRGVWKATFTVAADTYDLEAVLSGGANTDDDKVTGIKVEAAPKLVVTQPVAGDDVGGATVNVRISFANGHDLQTMTIALQDVAGNNESVTADPVDVARARRWGPDPYNGQPGDRHQIVVVGNDGTADVIEVTVGGLNVS